MTPREAVEPTPMTKIVVPERPFERFAEIYGELNRERGWWGDASALRYAAITAMTCPGDAAEVASSIRRNAEDIRRGAGWFGSLNSSLKLVVSALLLEYGDTADGLLAEVDRVGEMFRSVNLRRGRIYEAMAILMLRIQNRLEPISIKTVMRFQAIYEEMKHYHWWLTGPDDFPTCALLTGQEDSIEEIGSRIEDIYQALVSAGFSTGDPLQTASNVLYLAQQEPTRIALRFFNLAQSFQTAGVAIWKSDYDELAVLTFLDDHPVERIVERVLEHRASVATLRPRADRSTTFSLGASLTFLELLQFDKDFKRLSDTKVLLEMQAVINAQNAAATAAASSAASASH